MGDNALNQQVNTYIAIAFVASLALGAGSLIVKVANQDNFAVAPTLSTEEDQKRR